MILQACHLPCFATLNTKPDLYFASVKCMNGVRGQTISAWSWLPLIILAVHSILFVLIFWNMSRPDSKLCQVPRKSCLGPAELLQLEDGGGGPFQENNLSPALSDRGGYPANRHIHQKNCQTIVCFLLISSEYCCWTRPAEVPGLHFFLQHNTGAEFNSPVLGGVYFLVA